jgi:hypothetical protein
MPTKNPESPNPIGRPSKYDPKFCEIAVQYLSEGYSVTALAGHIGVARSTVFKWADENAEFSDSLRTGQALAAKWWENQLREIVQGGQGNATAAIFGVKNRSREEWKDKHETEITGPDGGPVQIQEIKRLVVDPTDTNA